MVPEEDWSFESAVMRRYPDAEIAYVPPTGNAGRGGYRVASAELSTGKCDTPQNAWVAAFNQLVRRHGITTALTLAIQA